MPTVLILDGYSIVIYMQYHQPPHVHVFARGCEAIFNLGCPQGPPTLRNNHRFKHHEVSIIGRLLQQSLEKLCEAWRRIYDHR